MADTKFYIVKYAMKHSQRPFYFECNFDLEEVKEIIEGNLKVNKDINKVTVFNAEKLEIDLLIPGE
jgi:hypothetical protein